MAAQYYIQWFKIPALPTSTMTINRRSVGIGLFSLGFLICLWGGASFEHRQRDVSELSTGTDTVEGSLGWSELSWSALTPTKDLVWEDCYDSDPLYFQCARLQVPLNYSEPDGRQATIALIRIPANITSDSGEYLGPVLFNPGGPGGSGVDFLRKYSDYVSSVLGPQFDLVSFDPRGIARSTPKVSFFPTRAEREFLSPDSVRELNLSSETVGSFWAQHQIINALATEQDQDVLAHINTDHTARDMLRITEAHGLEKIQYWGFSYGTVLGSTFASMFPDKVHRLVIDGVVDVDGDYYTAQWRTNLIDTDSVLEWFFRDCFNAGPKKCAFYAPSVQDISIRLQRLYKSIIRSPVAVHTRTSYGVVDYAQLRKGIFLSLYKPFATWAQLAIGLAELEAGNGTAVYQLLAQEPFSCSCNPSEHRFDNVPDGESAIACNDGDEVPSTLEEAERHYKEVLQISEWGSLWAGLRIACGAWRRPKPNFRGPIGGNTSFPLLLIGNTADPVTPLWAARKVSKAFPGSVVLHQDSAGHCSITSPSPCTTEIVRNYFVHGVLPEAGTKCPIIGNPFTIDYKFQDHLEYTDETSAQRVVKLEKEERRLLQAYGRLTSSDVIQRMPLHV